MHAHPLLMALLTVILALGPTTTMAKSDDTTALVIGHMNPDTDSIISAIAVAYLNNKRGIPSMPAAQGPPNPESDYVLKRFGLAAPKVVHDVSGKNLFLVDFSDLSQAPKGIGEAEILGIVDHHKLGDVTSHKPLEIWTWPVGCACTVVKSMYDFYGVEIPKDIAGALMCAILSDTVILRSPTTTERDRMAVEALAKIAGVNDYKAIGTEMFKVKCAVDGVSAKELVSRDYKDFTMNGKKVGIGQIEVLDLTMLNTIKDDLYREIVRIKNEGYHSVFLMLTDITNGGVELLVASDDPSVVEKAFGKKLNGRSVWLEGVMSRKKQVVPNLEKAFK